MRQKSAVTLPRRPVIGSDPPLDADLERGLTRQVLRPLIGAARLQLGLLRRNSGSAQVLVGVPFFAVIFLAVVVDSSRFDLVGDAVLGAALMGIWAVSLFLAGGLLTDDRRLGVSELLLATPGGTWPVLVGRVGVVSVFSSLAFGETWLVAAVLFHRMTVPSHPVVFVLGLIAMLFATSGVATVIAALFSLSRYNVIARNSLSYPFYILGGVILPVSALPEWLRALARLFYLSWSADLLRDSLRPGPVADPAGRMGVVALIGGVAIVIGWRCLIAITNRQRGEGTGGHI